MTDTSMTAKDFLDRLDDIPGFFNESIPKQVAIQVARTIRDYPDLRSMMIFTFDKNRNPPIRRFAFSLDNI